MKHKPDRISLRDCLKSASVNELANNPKHFAKLLHQLQEYYAELDRLHKRELDEFKQELEMVEKEYDTTVHEAVETLQAQIEAYEKEIQDLKDKNRKLGSLKHANEVKIAKLEENKKEAEDKNRELTELIKSLYKYCEKHEIPQPDERLLGQSNAETAENAKEDNQENVLK